MSFCSDEIPLLSASIAVALSKNMTADELNIFGNFIVAIGSEMLTVAAIRSSSPDDPVAKK